MKNNIRNIIQIAETHDPDNAYPCLAALCDDSTVWIFKFKEWQLIPPLPQVEIDQESEPEADIDPEVIDTDEFE